MIVGIKVFGVPADTTLSAQVALSADLHYEVVVGTPRLAQRMPPVRANVIANDFSTEGSYETDAPYRFDDDPFPSLH